MKKTLPIIFIVTIVLIGLFIFLPSSQNGPIIESDDSLVKLNIPQTALPSDVMYSDISIVKEKEDTYVLEPDGLEFNEPITVEFLSQRVDDSLPLPQLISGEGENETTEFLSEITIDIDPETGSETITGRLSHFSRLKINRNILYFTINPTGDTYVGLPVEATGSLEWPKNVQSPAADLFVDDKIGIVGSIEPKGSVLSPSQEMDERPGIIWINFGDKTDFKSSDFTCVREGKGSLFWKFTIAGSVKRFLGDKGHYREEPAGIYPRVSIPVKCVEPELIYLGPQYFIDCGKTDAQGKPIVLTGYYKYDENQNMVTDKDGNGYDLNTGKLVVCP